MGSKSKFTSYVTMISNFIFIITNKFFTNLTIITFLKQVFFFFSHNQFFIKIFFYYFFAMFIFFKNCFNKFIGCIFTPINNGWFSKFIINANNFISKTTRNMVLIFFCIRTFIALTFFKITLKISINFKRNWYLVKIIFKLNYSFF